MILKAVLQNIALLCLLLTAVVSIESREQNGISDVKHTATKEIIKTDTVQKVIQDIDVGHNVHQRTAEARSSIPVNQQNIKKINEILKSEEKLRKSANGHVRAVTESDLDIDCDPPVDIKLTDKNKEKIQSIRDKVRKLQKNNKKYEDGLFVDEDEIITDSDIPIQSRPKPEHDKQTKNKPSTKDDEENVEEDEVTIDEEGHRIPNQDEVERLKSLIRKLRKSGVSWSVINRQLFGDDYFDDYIPYRPEVVERPHYLRRRFRRPYFGRYAYYRPTYEEDDYPRYIPEPRPRIRPVYYEDYLKKK